MLKDCVHRLSIGGSASFQGEWVTNPRGKDQQEFKVNKVTWIGESDAEVRSTSP